MVNTQKKIEYKKNQEVKQATSVQFQLALVSWQSIWQLMCCSCCWVRQKAGAVLGHEIAQRGS
jgi:hypothetical protein